MGALFDRFRPRHSGNPFMEQGRTLFTEMPQERTYFRRGNVGGHGMPFEFGAEGGANSVLLNPDADLLDWQFEMQSVPPVERRGTPPDLFTVDEVTDFDRLNRMNPMDMTPHEHQRLDEYRTWIELGRKRNPYRIPEREAPFPEQPLRDWTPPSTERQMELQNEMLDIYRDIMGIGRREI